MRPCNRREFLIAASAAAAWAGAGRAAGAPTAAGFGTDVAALLADWCGALLKLQVRDDAKPEEDGAFRCPACGLLHGRCGDATYPFLHLAARTGRSEFLDAALRVRAWMKNVDQPDGSWLNDPGKGHTWKGITVFGGIALAESLHHHGTLLDAATRAAWTGRLRAAAEFVWREFHWNGYSNINYPVTAAYAFALWGRVLDEPRYAARGREWARKSLEFLTPRDRLLFGEGKPYEKRGPKGGYPVDLGYNVEESLPALVQYGLLEKDEEILGPVTASLKSHLEFMLPDGGWDNSWGTRSYKWTWWGSRTSDGCLPAYALLAPREPAFADASIRHLALLRACTHDGLLHGGPHVREHGTPPCVHHTFCHAKALATVLDHPAFDPAAAATVAIPRARADGVREFQELRVWLAARGPWRATVSAMDWFNTRKDMTVRQATGGSLSVLWHEKAGAIMCGSLAEYLPWEPSNMQPLKGPDIPLTPRVERIEGGARFSNLFDDRADVSASDEGGTIVFRVKTRLLNAAGKDPAAGPAPCDLVYRLSAAGVTIEAVVGGPEAGRAGTRLVASVVATPSEKAAREGERGLRIVKSGGASVRLSASAAPEVDGGLDSRFINYIPGFMALPVAVAPDAGGRCRLEIRTES